MDDILQAATNKVLQYHSPDTCVQGCALTSLHATRRSLRSKLTQSGMVTLASVEDPPKPDLCLSQPKGLLYCDPDVWRKQDKRLTETSGQAQADVSCDEDAFLRGTIRRLSSGGHRTTAQTQGCEWSTA